MALPRTLVIIPSFNERENIGALIKEIIALSDDVDVLVVDDASPDGTAEAVRNLQVTYENRLFLIVRQGKGGRGSAVLEGFQFGLNGPYERIIEMDADFSHKPQEIPVLIQAAEQADCVVGSRYLPGSEIHHWGWKRTFFSAMANRYARAILHIPLSDYTNGFRCYRREAAAAREPVRTDAKGYVVLSEVAFQLHRKGFKFGQVPTVFVNRRRGVSNLSSKEISEAFLSVLRIRFPGLAVHVEQGFKFGIAGGMGALIDLGTLTLLVRAADMAPEIAVFFSTFLALLCVFLMNKFVTFKHRKGRAHTQLLRFGILYATAIILNLGISIGLMRLGVHYFLAKVLAIGIVMFWNYFGLNTFVFRHQES